MSEQDDSCEAKGKQCQERWFTEYGCGQETQAACNSTNECVAAIFPLMLIEQQAPLLNNLAFVNGSLHLAV